MNNTTSLTKMHHEMVKLRDRAEKAEASVPEEWREFVKRTAEVGLHATKSGVECTCYRCVAIRGARALLQSAEGYSSQAQNEVRHD